MKKILLALVLTGSVSFGTEAQSNNKFAKNYTVCRAEDGTYVVCSNDKLEPVESNYRAASYEARKTPVTPLAVPCVNITRPPAVKVGYRWDNGQKIRVIYDETKSKMEPLAPMNGEHSDQNDGPDANAIRNLNYGSGQYVPPSTGEVR
jgi:hypothetical protein